mgnify:CR=1 FL=1
MIETGETRYARQRFPLHGEHQLENLATALAVVGLLDSCGLPGLTPEAIGRGVSNVSWPGRCQVLRDEPPLIVDGAHNPAAALYTTSTYYARLMRPGIDKPK